MEDRKVVKFLVAILFVFLLICVALAVTAQSPAPPPPIPSRHIEWLLRDGYVRDRETFAIQGSYTLGVVTRDDRPRERIHFITIGGRQGEWIVILITQGAERPRLQEIEATGIGGLTRWVPRNNILEIGDIRGSLIVRGDLEEVQ